MNKEIGSEFWDSGPTKRNQVYLLAGRTALEYIIRDIKKNHTIYSVLLPSYCCHTMIEPFVCHRISVRFYDVYFDALQGVTVDIPSLKQNEIFYYMEYFGFSKIQGIDIKKLQEKQVIILEDTTHSWTYKNGAVFGDYSYASYRKWTGFDAIAIAEKNNGYFTEFPMLNNEKYCALRNEAALLKKRFIENDEDNKNKFLSLYAKAEELLEEDYIDYAPMKDTLAAFLCWDKKAMVQQRKENAKLIIDEIKVIPQIQLLYDAVQEDDVPLFVPVLIKEDRLGLRKFLIDNQVYCPIHWPLSEYHNGISEKAKELYEEELSLICDQRYELDDIKRMIDLIKKFYMR